MSLWHTTNESTIENYTQLKLFGGPPGQIYISTYSICTESVLYNTIAKLEALKLAILTLAILDSKLSSCFNISI